MALELPKTRIDLSTASVVFVALVVFDALVVVVGARAAGAQQLCAVA
jgi:hypothetical protein